MRAAPTARARTLISVLTISASVWLGCGQSGDEAVSVTWAIDPAPPVTSTVTTAQITLRDRREQPVRGARLRLEGHMAHPGMTPVVSQVTEREDGTYTAPVHFTMAGDWTLVLTGELQDGTRITKQLEVTGVRSGT